MATVTSISGGNWSDGAIWSTGTPPSSIDDVVISNGHIVQADVDIVVNSITQDSGYNPCGLQVTSDRVIVVNTTLATTHRDANWYTITITASGANISITIGGDLIMGVYESNNLSIGGSNNTIDISCSQIRPGNSTYAGSALTIAGTDNRVNITGSINGTRTGANSSVSSISVGSSNTCHVTGSISNTNCPAISVSGTLLINATVIGSSALSLINGSGLVRLETCVITQLGNINALPVSYLTLDENCDVVWTMQTNNALVESSLYSLANGTLGQAAEADVKLGVVYGPSNELTGTYDPDVVDVAQLAVYLAEEIRTSPEPEFVRMRNCQTPEINQQQLTATLGG